MLQRNFIGKSRNKSINKTKNFVTKRKQDNYKYSIIKSKNKISGKPVTYNVYLNNENSVNSVPQEKHENLTLLQSKNWIKYYQRKYPGIPFNYEYDY